MIVVRLMGGLGNQLFQYALGRHLAHLNNSELYFDLSYLQNPPEGNTPREFELDKFQISYKIADEKLLDRFHGSDFDSTELWITKLITLGKFKKYKFNDYGFNDEVLKLRGNYFVRGFFQSEKYFKDVADAIREELVLLPEYHACDASLCTEIKANPKSVSVHIRRGDYVKNLASMDAHGICSKDYYAKSIKYMQEQIGEDAHFYIFTDDSEWVKKEMNWKADVTLLDDQKAIYDFHLMSMCKHNIIANSTFSWWSAWLNKNPEKMVIIPKQWTPMLQTVKIDLAPKNWLVK